MVFSSIPAYLDPSNWQQQPSHQIRGEGSSAIIQLNQQNPQLLPPPPPPPPRPPPPSQPQHPHVIGGGGGGVDNMISPRSMSERARLANIPIPEAALNCPRCESTNTKFCYFNNYNLTQPRHFCKTCRRYWTRGGALRSVPVGGGCRRNKRSKNNTTTNSKSMSTSSTDRHTPSSSTSTISSYSGGGGGGGGGRPTANTLLDLTHHLPSSHMAFSSPLGQLSDQSGVNNFNYSSSSSFLMGDHHPSSHHEMNYQMGCNNLLGSGSLEQWRLNHLQLLGGLNNNNSNSNSSSLGNGLYQFQTIVPLSGFVGDTSRDQVIIRDQNKPSNSVLLNNHHHHQHQHQLDSTTTTTKMEENQGLTRNLMGNPTNNAWTGGGGGGGGAAATWSDYLTRFSNRNP